MSTLTANGAKPLELVEYKPYVSGTAPRTPGVGHVGRFLGTVAHLGTFADMHGRIPADEVARAGFSELSGPTGGFTVPFGVAQSIFDKIREEDGLLARARYLPSQFVEFDLPSYAETARTDGNRWGGIRGYWGTSDTASLTSLASGPRAAAVRFKMNRLLIFSEPISRDLAADSSLITAFFDTASFGELRFALERAMVAGSGVGEPLGILNSPATATIAADGGQTASTITATNVSGMWKALWGPCRRNAIWLANDDTIEQIDTIAQLSGWAANVYLPMGANGNPYPLLRGRPLLPCEACPTLGTVGDLILIDPSQMAYTILNSKPTGSMPAEPVFEVSPGRPEMMTERTTSEHPLWDYDQLLIRYKLRADARLLWSAPIDPLNGSAKRYPVVVVATRA